MNDKHDEEIMCPKCYEWTTRGDPCCPGVPDCPCEDCEREGR